MSTIVRTYITDPLERAGNTFLQQMAVVLTAAGGTAVIMGGDAWLAALIVSAYAAAISLITTYAALVAKWQPKTPLADFVARIVKTFVQSFAGVILGSAATTFVMADWTNALAIAIPVTLLAVLKGLAALSLPITEGASLLKRSPVNSINEPAA